MNMQKTEIQIQNKGKGEHMRKEATIEQWKELYEVATRIKEMKPWNKFWDLDIIGIR